MVAENIERATEGLSQEIGSLVASPRPGSEFNSAELFVSLHERELYLSSGLSHRTAQTRVYTEAAYSTPADEYLAARWSVGTGNLELSDLFRSGEAAARETLSTQLPEPGTYWILVDADVLGQMFAQVASQLSGANAYLGLPFRKPGDPFIADPTGDRVSLTLDPTLNLGADSLSLNDQGVVQRPLTLVEAGVVKASMISKQYADYLGRPPTTTRGNFVVPAGSRSHGELMAMQPRVLEILQFSALFGDGNTGTFSSEIKLARLHENGKTRAIKGGSVSINLFENFRQVYFSKETVRRAHFEPAPHFGLGGGREYLGPKYALIGGVPVSS
jgi:predicted Zn-dependent protease